MLQPLVPQEGWCSWSSISNAMSLFDFSVGAASFLPDCYCMSDLCQSARKTKLLVDTVSSLSDKDSTLAKLYLI